MFKGLGEFTYKMVAGANVATYHHHVAGGLF